MNARIPDGLELAILIVSADKRPLCRMYICEDPEAPGDDEARIVHVQANEGLGIGRAETDAILDTLFQALQQLRKSTAQ